MPVWLAPLTGIVGDWLKNRRAEKQAESKRKIAVIERQAEQARDKQAHDSQWELAQIREADKLSRRFVLLMVTAPVFVTVIWPEHGARIWTNLKLVPLWYAGMMSTIFLASWGIRKYQLGKHGNGGSK